MKTTVNSIEFFNDESGTVKLERVPGGRIVASMLRPAPHAFEVNASFGCVELSLRTGCDIALAARMLRLFR